jgi:hypothetical protein
MNSFTANLVTCAACTFRARGCAGPCPCTVDGVDSMLHAAAGVCVHPDGPRYGTAERPADWPPAQRMATPQSVRSKSPEPPAIAERRRICAACDNNVADARGHRVCRLVEAKRPGMAYIDNGVLRPDVACPAGKWGMIEGPSRAARSTTEGA